MSGKDGAKRAAIYCRISRDKVGAGLGVDRQEGDCRELAERLGWTVEVVRVDNDISAYSGKPRPGYLALLEDIRAGRVEGVLVWHTDRLHRSPVELEGYIRACESGNGRAAVETQTVKAGLLDLATPTGRMVARTLGNIAHYEVEHMIERQKASKKQKREAGRYSGGPRGYGHRPDGNGSLAVVEDEALEIRAAAARILAGDGLYAIARDMNARGARTPVEATRGGGGRMWKHNTLRAMLLRPTLAGLIEYDGQIVGRGQWEPVIDEGTWRGVRAILTDPARRTTPGPKPRWLLTGTLVCGVCGTRDIRVLLVNKKYRNYVCKQGGHIGRSTRLLDEYLEWVIIERLRQPDAADAYKNRVDVAELSQRREGLRARLDELATAYGEQRIDMEQMTAGSKPLRAALADIEAQLEAAFRQSPVDAITSLPDPAKTWAGWTIDQRRAAVKAMIDAVVIYPTRSNKMPASWRPGEPRPLNQDAIEIVWRTP